MKRLSKGVLATGMMVLAGCGVTSQPERAYIVAQPKTPAVKNITSFDQSLRCMDDLFASFGVRDVAIASAGIPDETGKITAGTKDMLISAISKMSVKSGAFRFIDFDQTQRDVAILFDLGGFAPGFEVPPYYIRGAITQVDQGVLSESIGGSVVLEGIAELGATKDQIVSVVSVDMNVGDLPRRQILPGVSSNNSIAVQSDGIGGDAGATVGIAGIFFNISLNKSEGTHAATRNLIELSTIEILGKLTRVPYWRCLQIEQTNPEMIAQARDWFEAMSSTEQVTFIQEALASQGYYAGPATGTLDPASREAIGRYQDENGLLANGRVDFDLYARLIADDLALGQRPQATPVVASAAASSSSRLNMSLRAAGGPIYRVEDAVQMTVSTSQDSYLYCFYEDATGTVARIFPNRFAPDPYVLGGNPVSIPGRDSGFQIVLERPGVNEQVACMASKREIGPTLPNTFQVADLTPLPVASLEDVVSEYQRQDPNNLAVSRLVFDVAN